MKNTHDSDDRRIAEQQTDENDLSSPIGRLMSDDIETDEEQNTFVSGFERNKPDFEEPPAPVPVERRRPRPERPAPTVDSDEDFFETGIREARASRERDRERRRNPDPRPAVRATVPTSRRMTGPLPRRSEGASQSTGPLPEDKYDTFRQRYNPDDLISAGRGGRPPARRGAPPSRGGENRGRDRDYDNDGENPNLLRWVGIAGVFVLLILLVFMIGSRSSINRRYNEAQERIAYMETAYARYDSMVRERDSLRTTVNTRDTRITYLENQLALQNNDGVTEDSTQPGQEQGTGPGAADTNETPPSQQDFPRTHVVEAGQNLTRITRIHYGDGTATENHLRMLHIAAYNNIPYPFNVAGGQSITIPPPPTP